jgi:hypothetical protein
VKKITDTGGDRHFPDKGRHGAGGQGLLLHRNHPFQNFIPVPGERAARNPDVLPKLM